ncbi:hypothetical protein SUGI_0561890 [Cryptomeria japonica]|nr:hypothetical protein SUGI_0561890 [Cryptomeria japonica]
MLEYIHAFSSYTDHVSARIESAPRSLKTGFVIGLMIMASHDPTSETGVKDPELGSGIACKPSSLSELRAEDAFFYQVLVGVGASVILLAKAKMNAIHARHFECNCKPVPFCLNYLAEFSVAMPILGFTTTIENVTENKGTVQIYCVQTQDLQQYSLEMPQCLAPQILLTEMIASSGMKSPSSINIPEASTSIDFVYPSAPHAQGHFSVSYKNTTFGLPVPINVPTDNAPLSSQVFVHSSPRLSRRLSGTKDLVQIFKHDVSPMSSGYPFDIKTAQEHSIERKSGTVVTSISDLGSVEVISACIGG